MEKLKAILGVIAVLCLLLLALSQRYELVAAHTAGLGENRR